MVTYIKEGQSDQQKQDASTKVEQAVSGIIKDIEARGDTAVRELSEKFDKWSPESFLLSPEDIQTIIGELPKQVIEDIQFAQEQIQNFARHQRSSIQDIEVETRPGVFLGHKNIPVNSVGCYIPGGRLPNGRFFPHEYSYCKSCRSKTCNCLHPSKQRRSSCSHDRSHAHGRS